jgi:hypothetical protein
MRGAISPLPNTPSWSDAKLKKEHRDKFTLSQLYGNDIFSLEGQFEGPKRLIYM